MTLKVLIDDKLETKPDRQPPTMISLPTRTPSSLMASAGMKPPRQLAFDCVKAATRSLLVATAHPRHVPAGVVDALLAPGHLGQE